jgi:hypothetical protein
MGYLPKIEKIADGIIEALIEDKFFEDFEIEDHGYAKKRLCEELTNKFLINGLEEDDFGIFSDDEFDKILKEIVAEDMLRGLQKKGLINSYEDENTEEIFFLTEKGREEMVKKTDDDSDVLNIFTDDSEA